MLRIDVRDFGPVARASVQLKPLTVFVGANNSGKSYIATLVYAFFSALRGEPVLDLSSRWPRFWMAPEVEVSVERAVRDLELTKEDVRHWLIFQRGGDPAPVPLSPAFVQAASEIGRAVMHAWARVFGRELKRCFAVETLSELARWGRDAYYVTIATAGRDSIGWKLEVRLKGDDIEVSAYNLDIMSVLYHRHRQAGIVSAMASRYLEGTLPLRIAVYMLIEHIREVLLGAADTQEIYYLPAARSGILQAHRALAGAVVRSATSVGLERLEIPTLSGVVADFVARLLLAEGRKRRGRSQGTALADEVAQRILRGDILMERAESKLYPEIYYQVRGKKLPLYQASSMVQEIAPIVIFMREWADRGDLVVLEEPESHLHPETQAQLALVLVSTAKKGLTLLVTTHSDYLLGRINNLIKASALQREEMPESLAEAELIRPSKVAAYLFKRTGDGTLVESLKISGETGIPEDEFRRVAEELYEESWEIDRRAGRTWDA